jgi:hypothetical protein
MLIKELHKDIERYLRNDCYCPHEVYSFDGFGYQLFYEDQKCERLGEKQTDNSLIIGCVAYPFNDETYKPQVVLFFIEDDKCVDAIRYDATENNIEITKDILTNGINGRKFHFDEYEKGRAAKELKEILSYCDAIMID